MNFRILVNLNVPSEPSLLLFSLRLKPPSNTKGSTGVAIDGRVHEETSHWKDKVVVLHLK